MTPDEKRLAMAMWLIGALTVAFPAYLVGRTVESRMVRGPSIWGYECVRVDEPEAKQVLCVKR